MFLFPEFLPFFDKTESVLTSGKGVSMNRKYFLRSVFFLYSILLSLPVTVNSYGLKKSNALMDIPGKQPVMVEVNQKDQNCLILKYYVPQADIITLNETYNDIQLKRIQLGNAPLAGNEGEPVLPVIPAQFIIPAGKTISSINIQRNKQIILPGKHFIEFGKASIPLISDVTPNKSLPKYNIYDNNDAFPLIEGSLANIQSKRGVKIAFVNINPVQYLPKSGIVVVYTELLLQVNLKDDKTNRKSSLSVKVNNLDPLKLGIENPEALQTYQTSIKSSVKLKSKICTLNDSSISYVIITSQSFRDANTDYTVLDLVEHRRAMGFTAKVVTVEEIYSVYPGTDEAEQIRNFIIDAYINWNTEYVVLGGDVDIIPYRNLYNDSTFIPSDLYFQCLDGSFNDDGDLYWGEPNDGPDGSDVDLMSEVSVGRISAETPQEMANSIFKTITYETMEQPNSFFNHSCILAEKLGSQFGPGEFSYATPYMEEIRLGSTTCGYSTKGFNSCSSFVSDTLYDNSRFSWRGIDLIACINSDNISIINHLGNAGKKNIMKLSSRSIDKLTNSNPIFAYSQGCYSGYFPENCMAEYMTTSTRNGMFAVVFNSVNGYVCYNESRETLDGPSQRFNRQFWDAFFSEKIFYIGDINADSHEDNIWCVDFEQIRYCMYETNLFGDPATMLRGQVEGSFLFCNDQYISDTQGGNNDGIANPGEQIDLLINIQNTGSEASVNSFCSLTSADAYVTIPISTANLPPIACCGNIQQTTTPFIIQISEECPTPYTVILKLIIKSGDSTWISQIPLLIYRPSSINGRVFSNTGEIPINDATVFYNGPISGSVNTNVNGQYVLNLIEGSYIIYAVSKGYLGSDSVLISIPPAAVYDIRLFRPQLSVEPTAIEGTIKNNDSISIPVQISNTGDAFLHVEISDRQVSRPLFKGNPLQLPARTDYVTEFGKSENRFGMKVLYLTTLPVDTHIIKGIDALLSVQSVDTVNGEKFTPNLDFLLRYDCVILSSDVPWADPFALGNYLAEYADGGHLIIMLADVFSTEDASLQGRIMEPDYLPIKPAGRSYEMQRISSFLKHPITSWVDYLETDHIIKSDSTQGEGISLGKYSNENHSIAVAYNPVFPIVAINLLPINGHRDGNLVQMISNCIEWGAGGKWLRVEPENTIYNIAPGSSESFTIGLFSENLLGGLYTGEILLSTNDPSFPKFILPVNLTVDGFRSLKTDPSAALDFNEVWYNFSDTILITLINNGNEVTTVSALNFSDESFYCIESVPFKIRAQNSTHIHIVCRPNRLGHFNETLNIESDAEDSNSNSLQLIANSVKGPEAVIEPACINFNFQPNDSPADKSFVLSNIGNSTLKYSVIIKLKSKPEFKKYQSAIPGIPIGDIFSQFNNEQSFVDNCVIVGFKKGKSNFSSSNILNQAGVKSVTNLINGISPVTGAKSFTLRTILKVELNNCGQNTVLEAINLFSKDPNVEYVEPDYLVEAAKIPNDPLFINQYALNNSGQTGGSIDADIDAVEAWEISDTNHKEIIIGILDSGIDYLHPDLTDNIWKNPGEIPENGIDDDHNGFIDDYYGWDFANDDNDPMDDDDEGHGTHCSGIIAAKRNNNTGVCGVMPNAKLMAIKFMAGGSGTISKAINAISYAIAMNVPLINTSWCTRLFSSQALKELIATSGVFVAPAGNNNGTDVDTRPYFPASFDCDNIISVASTNHRDQLSFFSNYGQRSVDLAAPGDFVISTVPNNSYDYYSGSSAAAAYVTGAIGLVMSNNPGLSVTEIKNALLETVDTLSSLQGKTVSGGRLNVHKFLKSTNINWISVNPKNDDSLLSSDSREFTVTVNPQKLAAGSWNVDIVFETNDPVNKSHIVNVIADVTGCKSVYTNNETVDFGKIWNGMDTTIPIILTNQCNDRVTLSGCTFDNSVFRTSMVFPAVIKPFDSIAIPVTLSPINIAEHISAVAVITSDAQDNPSVSVYLEGSCINKPSISVNPEYLKKTIKYGVLDSDSFVISNSGDGDYQFKVSVKSQQKAFMNDMSNTSLYLQLKNSNMLMKIDPQTGNSVDSIDISQSNIRGMAYDEKFIYYTLSGPDIYVFDLSLNKVVRTFTIQDSFFLGSLGVTDKYIVAGAAQGKRVYIIDKNDGEIITSWNCEIKSGLTYSESRNSLFISNKNMSIDECDLLSGKLLNRIWPDNFKIEGLSYSNSADVLFSQNINGTLSVIDPQNGSTIKNYPDLKNITAIASDEIDTLNWIRIDPLEGNLSAGENLSLRTIFCSGNHFPGTYYATIAVKHISSIIPDIEIPCTLSISGEKRLDSNPLTIDFPEIWKGRSDSAIVYLVNNGNEPTTITSVYSTNTVFSFHLNCPATVNAFDSIPLVVRCSPNKQGITRGVINVKSDASNNPVLSINASVNTVKPPKITIKPKSLSVAMYPNAVSNHYFGLFNSGGADYPFKASIVSDNSNEFELYIISEGLYKINPVSGTVIDTILPCVQASSLAFDGKYVYLADNNSNYIVVVDPEIKQIIKISSFPAINGISGLAATSDKLIGYGITENKFIISDKNTGEIVYQFDYPSQPVDFSYCSRRNSLFVHNNQTDNIDELSIEDGSHINSFYFSGSVTGITYSSISRLLMVSGSNNITYLDPQSGVFLYSVVTESVTSLVSDEVNFNDWITSDIKNGNIVKNSSSSYEININSTKMMPGQYFAKIIFEHEKSWAPGPFITDCKLKVKSRKLLSSQPENLNFGKVVIGNSRIISFDLINDGNDSTTVKKVTSSSSKFDFDLVTPFKIPPFSRIKINATYTPSESGFDAGLLTIKTNASNVSNLIMNIRGTGVPSPIITINPPELSKFLQPGMKSTDTLFISNTGGSDYAFSISTSENKTNLQSNYQDAQLFICTDTMIYQLDPVHGSIIGTGIPLPKHETTGFAYDGDHFYVLSKINYHNSEFYILNSDSGAVIERHPFRERFLSLGLGKDIVATFDDSRNEILVLNRITFQIINIWKVHLSSAKLTTSQNRQSIFIGTNGNNVIEERSIIDGSVINNIELKSNFEEIAFSDNTGLLFFTSNRNTIYAIDPDKDTVIHVLYTSVPILGMAADGIKPDPYPKWLKTTVLDTVVNAGHTVFTVLDFNSEDLPEGQYTGSVVITPKEFGPGPLTIPCTLNVEPVRSALK